MSNNYESYRSKIKSGDLIAISHYKWASLYDLQVQVVRLATQSEYSHVGMVWRVNGRVFMLESVTPFIRIVPLSMFAKEGFYHIPLKTAPSSAEIEFALSQVGNGEYSKWQAIKAFFKGIKIGADRLWECAEYVITCRRISGVDLGDKATPSAVVQAALDQGYQITFVKD